MVPADTRDRGSLVRAMRQGGRPKFLFFWSHQPPRGGGVGRGCLSQWWPSEFELEGVRYPTAEHYMMAQKARLFGDTSALATILEASHPGAAKRAGREVRGFDEDTWARFRSEIVVRGNEAKFRQNSGLSAYLLGTGSRILVEASPRDQVWGIGLAENDPTALEPARWRGLNLLGFALMEVRARLGS